MYIYISFSLHHTWRRAKETCDYARMFGTCTFIRRRLVEEKKSEKKQTSILCFLHLRSSRNLANEPYEPRVSAAIIIPPSYLIAKIEVPEGAGSERR